MRTTLTLDPDVARLLKEKATDRGSTFKKVVNDALRRGLRAESKPPRKRFRVTPHLSGFQPGIDPRKLNQLADELETQAIAARLERSRSAKRG
jgi:hypothetical protein